MSKEYEDGCAILNNSFTAPEDDMWTINKHMLLSLELE